MACWHASLGWMSTRRAGWGFTAQVGFKESQGGELGECLKGEGEGLGRRAKSRVGRHCCSFIVFILKICKCLCKK